MTMNPQPPSELFLLIWQNPWLVLVTHDISDWGHKTEPPSYWVRYEFSDYGTVHTDTDESDSAGEEVGPLGSEEEREADGDERPDDPGVGDGDAGD